MSSSRPRLTPSSSSPRARWMSSRPTALTVFPSRSRIRSSTAKAMLLLRNPDVVLTIDARRRILVHHSILFEDGVITDIGPAAEMDARHIAACRSGGTIVEAAGCLLLPGYVNTHVHTFEHLSRGLIPDDLSTFAWAVTYARPFYAALTESGIRAVLGRGVFDRMPEEMVAAMAPALRERVLSPTADAALREVDAL